MNVLILSSNNPYKTSGIISLYLFNEFKKNGHNVKMIVKEHDNYADKDIVCLDTKRKILVKKVRNRLNKAKNEIFKENSSNLKLDEKYNIEDYDHTKQNYRTEEVLRHINIKPDVILFLFPNYFLNAKNLYEIGKFTGAPIFWYLMDSAALTGGCHYFWDCERYILGCGNCPGLYSNNLHDQSFINFSFKEKYLSKTNIQIISGTEMLKKQAMKSKLLGSKLIHKILLPVDHEIFKPLSKSNLKREYNIPIEKKIIFAGSSFLSNIRKGMAYLIDALHLVKDRDNICLILAGRDFEYLEGKIPVEYRYLGMLENNEELAVAFQVSDLFVCPSIEDAGPLMINQSIMCGTPVVSFDMGVANDLVFDGITGFKAKLKDSSDLSEKIETFLRLTDSEQTVMSHNCREFGLKFLKQSVFIEEFEKIFKNEFNENP